MSSAVLITGINGWSGCHAARAFLAMPNVSLVGVGRRDRLNPLLDDCADRIDYIQCDLAQHNPRLVHAMSSVDAVLHLASDMRSEWTPMSRTNVAGTAGLFQAMAVAGRRLPAVVVSSSAVYGHGSSSAILEAAPLAPLTPYGMTKVAAEYVARSADAAGIASVTIVRPFNLVGPLQPEWMLCASIAKQIVQAERHNVAPAIALGRTDTSRDFVDVRDAVELYRRLIEKPARGEVFNCGSGQATPIRTVLALLESAAGTRFEVTVQSELVRPADAMSQCADITAARRHCQWGPRYSLSVSLADTLETARQRQPAGAD